MKKPFIILTATVLLWSCNSPKPDTTASTESASQQRAIEFADDKYIDIGKQSLSQLVQGNVDGFVANFADNAVFNWSSGDSLANKEAIITYWKDRRANVIDTITFESEIWLPLKANQAPPTPGIWLLNWANFTIQYKNGKSVKMWIHHAYHFNNTDKIDRMIQYIDRAPIAAALAAK